MWLCCNETNIKVVPKQLGERGELRIYAFEKNLYFSDLLLFTLGNSAQSFMAYYKTKNTEKRNNETQNTGRTAEHPRIVAEQHNTPE